MNNLNTMYTNAASAEIAAAAASVRLSEKLQRRVRVSYERVEKGCWMLVIPSLPPSDEPPLVCSHEGITIDHESMTGLDDIDAEMELKLFSTLASYTRSERLFIESRTTTKAS